MGTKVNHILPPTEKPTVRDPTVMALVTAVGGRGVGIFMVFSQANGFAGRESYKIETCAS